MRSVLLAALVALGACGGSAKSEKFPDVRLARVDGAASESLASCPTPKCLTIVVAPWCGYCRRGTPMMLQVRQWLAQRGISTRVIVGLAPLGDLKEYAAEFGPSTLLDPDSQVKVTGGVPHFYVSDGQGRIVKDVAGLPMTDDPQTFAGFFGLP